MVSTLNSESFEIYYYYYWIAEYFKIFFSLNNNFNKFKKTFIFFLYFFKKNNFNFNNAFYFQNKFKFDKLKIYFDHRESLDFLNPDSDVISKNKIIIKTDTCLTYYFFNLFFLFNYTFLENGFSYYTALSLLGTFSVKNKIILTDPTKIIKRWHDAYLILLNVFYFNTVPLIFSIPNFKKEVSALNWNFTKLDINTWKYILPFFIFKLNRLNTKIEFFFEKLKASDLTFFIITDVNYHNKIVHYSNWHKNYSLGLVDGQTNPWQISFPVVVLSNTFFMQFFFLKLIIFINKHSELLKFKYFKKIWTTLIFYYKFKINIT